MYDVITVTKTGCLKSCLSVSSSEVSGVTIKMLKTTSPKLSFFVTSMKGLQDLSAKQVNAIDRIGEGPWYDRTGRVMAPTKADLIAVRPKNGDPTIQNDLPNENGIPNHRPDPTVPAVDNHHTITGSDANGKLKSATATCKDWTTKDGSAAANNGKPSAGFSWPRGGVVSTTARDGSNWMTTGEAPGCGAGIEIVENGPAPLGSIIIGGGGGYGGFYCFALNP